MVALPLLTCNLLCGWFGGHKTMTTYLNIPRQRHVRMSEKINATIAALQSLYSRTNDVYINGVVEGFPDESCPK